MILEWFAHLLIGIGVIFFMAGTIGLLRFPDIYSRLHALTKADNIGLGFVVIGLAILAGDFATTIKLFIIWILIVIASATSCYLIARSALRMNIQPKEQA